MLLDFDLIAIDQSHFAAPEMVHISAGRYRVGKDEYVQNHTRRVRLKAFSIAKNDVTNAEWQEFINATHYVTDVETRHDGMVFEPPLKEFRWIRDDTAWWRFPNGTKRGGIDRKMNHPVTAISFADALAYCRWAGYRLPTLDEWEVASRAGAKTDFFWGDSPDDSRKYANVWHGRDHLKSDFSDGYMYTSPVGTFAPNPLGLNDIYGNVFQFCSGRLPDDTSDQIAHARGGSWWCSKNACCFFNSVDIGTINIHATFSNQGFRLAK